MNEPNKPKHLHLLRENYPTVLSYIDFHCHRDADGYAVWDDNLTDQEVCDGFGFYCPVKTLERLRNIKVGRKRTIGVPRKRTPEPTPEVVRLLMEARVEDLERYVEHMLDHLTRAWPQTFVDPRPQDEGN